jgi:hypothetical protein
MLAQQLLVPAPEIKFATLDDPLPPAVLYVTATGKVLLLLLYFTHQHHTVAFCILCIFVRASICVEAARVQLAALLYGACMMCVCTCTEPLCLL